MTKTEEFNGRSAADVEAILIAAFSSADSDGVGVLPFSAMKACLEGCELGLSPNEVMGLLSLLSEDTPYSDLDALAFKILRSIATHGPM